MWIVVQEWERVLVYSSHWGRCSLARACRSGWAWPRPFRSSGRAPGTRRSSTRTRSSTPPCRSRCGRRWRRDLDELLADRAEASDQLRAAVASTAASVGLAVDALALRDVVVPAELRHAAAEVEAHPRLLQLCTQQAVETGGATVALTTDASRAAGTGAPL